MFGQVVSHKSRLKEQIHFSLTHAASLFGTQISKNALFSFLIFFAYK